MMKSNQLKNNSAPSIYVALSLTLLLMMAVLTSVLKADERILSFKSKITVALDGSMNVRETIQVRAEQKNIRRGIYRDFPTRYKDKLGNDYIVQFDVLNVKRDGITEDFHTEYLENGVRLYVGSKDYFLPAGIYTYVIDYKTDRQLGFFENHDELYWNVTGNGWRFPIDKVIAEVRLPQAISMESLSLEAYTGNKGAAGKDYKTNITVDGLARFESTRSFSAYEGLTLVTTWPKGFIAEPDLAQNIGYVLNDNFPLLLALLGLILIGLFYFFAWNKVGRDPEPGVIFPHYVPEKGFSPASMRYISKMSYDHKTFATAVVNLAAKGALSINESDKIYTLMRNQPFNLELAAGERVLLDELFSEEDSIVLKNENHRLIRTSIMAHKKSLGEDYNKIYFKMNSIWLLPGILTSLAFLSGVLFTYKNSAGPEGLFLVMWLSIWSVGVFFIAKTIIKLWRNAFEGKGYLGAIGLSVFGAPFFFAELFVIIEFKVSIPLVVSLAAIISLNFVFFQLLKSPTYAGRKLLDKIDGFKMYLDVAEKEELNLKNPPEKTPEIFEIYLPYAMALDVENNWGKKFTAVFASLEQQGKSVQPSWYHGSHWHHNDLGGFTKAMGSQLSSAISSSSTAPGSSSGSGGGGSSGGGGGGGGGGGW